MDDLNITLKDIRMDEPYIVASYTFSFTGIDEELICKVKVGANKNTSSAELQRKAVKKFYTVLSRLLEKKSYSIKQNIKGVDKTK
jgi:hypothetical protein